MSAQDSSVMKQYKTINSKLRKRFFRKPNYPEVCEDFKKLSLQCESKEMHNYAGVCWLASARVEATMGNKIGERNSLHNAADRFLKEEEDSHEIGVSSTEHNLVDGLHTYELVKSKYHGAAIPVKINLELVEFLKKIERTEYIQTYLDEAIALSEGRSQTKIFCMELLASHFIEQNDYWGALEAFVEISKTARKLVSTGYTVEVLQRAEISTVILILLYKPTQQSLRPELAQILERYSWGERDDPAVKACHMREELYIAMQSLVTECQSNDCSGLLRLEGAFWPYINTEQKDLLRMLVKEYYPYPY